MKQFNILAEGMGMGEMGAEILEVSKQQKVWDPSPARTCRTAPPDLCICP